MKSQTLPSFWTAYRSLIENQKKEARKAYHLWKESPFHLNIGDGERRKVITERQSRVI